MTTLTRALVGRLYDGKQLVRFFPFSQGIAPAEFVTTNLPSQRLIAMDPDPTSADDFLPVEKWVRVAFTNQQVWTREMWMLDCGPTHPPEGTVTDTGNGVRVQLVDYRRIPLS